MRARVRTSTIGALATNEKAMFVVVSVVVNLVLLLRSYVTMQLLDYRELGLTALLQSIILLIGALQFGLLNGGFRLICSAERHDARRINNLIYTSIGGLGLGAMFVTVTSLALIRAGDVDIVAVLGVAAGIVTLLRVWMTSQLVAGGALKRLNLINLASGLASLMPFILIPWDAFAACILAVILQPVAFVILSAVADRRLLPTSFETGWPVAKAVLSAGFIVFLTGIFVQLNVQMERWYVTAFLGLDALGHLYLTILFITLFQIVPTSLDQLFLPAAVRAYTAGDDRGLHRVMRSFFLVELGYCVLAALCVILLAGPVTGYLLPKYLPDLRYLHLVLPGLLLFALSGPFAVTFNVLIRYRTYFWAYGAGSVLTAAAFLYGAIGGGSLTLEDSMLVRSAAYTLIAVILIAGFVLVTRDRPGFRMFRSPAAGAAG